MNEKAIFGDVMVVSYWQNTRMYLFWLQLQHKYFKDVISHPLHIC